jgi:hypothetical protein
MNRLSQAKTVACVVFNPLNAKLNSICHLLALLRAYPILHISRIRVNQNWYKNSGHMHKQGVSEIHNSH